MSTSTPAAIARADVGADLRVQGRGDASSALTRMHALANYTRFLTANPAPGPVARALVLGALAPVRSTAAFIFATMQHPDHQHPDLHMQLNHFGATTCWLVRQSCALLVATLLE